MAGPTAASGSVGRWHAEPECAAPGAAALRRVPLNGHAT